MRVSVLPSLSSPPLSPSPLFASHVLGPAGRAERPSVSFLSFVFFFSPVFSRSAQTDQRERKNKSQSDALRWWRLQWEGQREGEEASNECVLPSSDAVARADTDTAAVCCARLRAMRQAHSRTHTHPPHTAHIVAPAHSPLAHSPYRTRRAPPPLIFLSFPPSR